VSGEPRPIHPGLFVEQADGPRLIAGRCPACACLHFPAAPTCPYCAADGCAPTHVGPGGRLRLFTAVTSRPPGYRGSVPYGFGVVETDGGLCVITRLTESHPERLRPGMAMRLVVEPLHTDDDGHPVRTWAFRPAEEA
jgi:uncharacterized OB-fold protein